ncbi:MAG: RsmB/NOP family class I SAM-dependent RNA methyltransferase [Longimicrobiales bacterium]
MSEVSPARTAALAVLGAVRRGRRLDRALESALRGVSPEEGPWVHAVTYGVIRLRGRLDHLLDRSLHAGLESVSPLVLDVLRLGAYQLLYMDAVPDYAALSQSVEQAKEVVGRRVAGLVNGVLRSVQRESLDRVDHDRESVDRRNRHRRGLDEATPGAPSGGRADPALFPDPEEDPVGHLATWGSHPDWMVERWLDRYGRDGAFRLVEENNRIPALSIRPIGLSLAEAGDRLEGAGIGSRPAGMGSRCLWIDDGVEPETVLETVPAVIQDPAASLVVEYASPDPGSRIADLCAAPGGKALGLASSDPSVSWVLAGDRSRRRLALLGPALERLKPWISPVYRVAARGEIPPVVEADFVLADVPCTGTGTLRRHPDGRWRLEPQDPDRLSGVQARILQGASGCVRPGGLLVYSTCTLEPEENEQVVSQFLARSDGFRIDPPGDVAGDLVDENGFLRVLPHETGFDGAFAARMRRMG